MEKFKEYSVKAAKTVGQILLYGTIAVGTKKLYDLAGVDISVQHDPNTNRAYRFRTAYSIATFADAVTAITKSDMFSSDKRDAIKSLEKDADSDYYESVIAIASDNTQFSSSRRDSIKSLV
jgi:hypothetical protein